jgi:acetolactate synthase-1/2/3 large subunit
VHISLPYDVLEDRVEASAISWPEASAFAPQPMIMSGHSAQTVLDEIARASRPLIIAPPMLCSAKGRKSIHALQQATGVPVVPMESPRGIHDPSLGAFAEVLPEADLIILLGKQLDFTLRFGKPPFVHTQCRWVVIEPDEPLIERVKKTQGERLAFSAVADAWSAIDALIDAANKADATNRHGKWLDTVLAAVAFRPAQWANMQTASDFTVHPAQLCQQLHLWLQQYPDAVFVSDGGEFGQWAQATVQAPARLINGVAGAIGPSIPFALAAKAARPNALVVAALGDGTFGFHMAEFDTAVRYKLPFVAIVGNDSRWNAEYQLQLRNYGEPRARGCELAHGTRYDLVASALGGHGEFVTNAADLRAALDRALASGKPACVNVLIESVAAPIVRRQ